MNSLFRVCVGRNFHFELLTKKNVQRFEVTILIYNAFIEWKRWTWLRVSNDEIKLSKKNIIIQCLTAHWTFLILEYEKTPEMFMLRTKIESSHMHIDAFNGLVIQFVYWFRYLAEISFINLLWVICYVLHVNTENQTWCL